MGAGSADGPLVSVCVPAYKAERFIAATIESVLAQTTEDWELVVVDDASPDGTYDVAARYAGDGRVRVARNATNLGPVGNWNHVVAQARGRYVKLLCSDDLLYPRLARQASALDAHPEAGMAASRRHHRRRRPGRLRRPGPGRLAGAVPGRAALERMVAVVPRRSGAVGRCSGPTPSGRRGFPHDYAAVDVTATPRCCAGGLRGRRRDAGRLPDDGRLGSDRRTCRAATCAGCSPTWPPTLPAAPAGGLAGRSGRTCGSGAVASGRPSGGPVTSRRAPP
jgi:glycosyltransferase involved in cell wall biosynthesis